MMAGMGSGLPITTWNWRTRLAAFANGVIGILLGMIIVGVFHAITTGLDFTYVLADLRNEGLRLLLFAIVFSALITFVFMPAGSLIRRKRLGRYVYGIPIASLALLCITLWLYGKFSDNADNVDGFSNDDLIKLAQVGLLFVAGIALIAFVVRPLAEKFFLYLLAAQQSRQLKREERTKRNDERNT